MITILPVEPSDYPLLADIEKAAFASSPISSTIFGAVSPAANRSHALQRFPHELRNPQKRLIKAVRDEEIIGWAQWEVRLKEGEEAYEPPKEEGPGWPEGTNLDEAEAFFPRLGEVMKIEEPHYHLAILVVDPAKQKTGAGRALVAWGAEQADRDGLDIYLESSPGAVEVYPKYGFEPFKEPIRGGTKDQLVVYPFRRGPRFPAHASSLPPAVPSVSASSTSPPSRPSLVDVSPASASDFPTLARCQLEAFRTSAITRFVFANVTDEDHLAQMTGRFEKAFANPYGAVTKATLEETGEIVGVGVWDLPKPEGLVEDKKKEKKADDKSRFPQGTNVELAMRFFGKIDFGLEERHLHLSILAVDPRYQKTGAGSALMQWGCGLADKEGVPMDLKSTDVGLGLYKKFGFAEYRAAVKVEGYEEIVLYPMMRPAREPPSSTV
ncbi:hypothetical protein JCM8547_007724 [Rhodosporidiobolus lusitaniae]